VSRVMQLQVTYKSGNFVRDKRSLDSQETNSVKKIA
jgi:hypothetical protein